LDAQVTSRELLGFDSRERFHQAALATGGVILVNDASFSSLIEAADGSQNGFLRGGITGKDGSAGVADSGAGGTTHCAVAQAAFFVLAITFDLRLNISQGYSSEKIFPITAGGNSTRQGSFCPVLAIVSFERFPTDLFTGWQWR
jgi:hypothetical protein